MGNNKSQNDDEKEEIKEKEYYNTLYTIGNNKYGQQGDNTNEHVKKLKIIKKIK